VCGGIFIAKSEQNSLKCRSLLTKIQVPSNMFDVYLNALRTLIRVYDVEPKLTCNNQILMLYISEIFYVSEYN
jgi:hypothetical protein